MIYLHTFNSNQCINHDFFNPENSEFYSVAVNIILPGDQTKYYTNVKEKLELINPFNYTLPEKLVIININYHQQRCNELNRKVMSMILNNL